MNNNRKNRTLETMVMHQLAEDRAKKSSKSMPSAKDAGFAEPTSTELGNAFDEVCAMALFPKMGVKNVIFPDGANDKGIDFYRIFEDGSITIAQCKYDEKFDLRHVQCEADKTRDFINDVCDGYVASEDFDPHEKPLNMPDKLDLLFDAICKICACEGRSAVFDKITYYCFMSVSQTGDREETVNKIKAEKGFGQVRIYAGQDIVKLNDDNLLDVEGVPNLDIGITASELASARAAAARKLGYINAMAKERAKESSEAGSDAEFTPLDMFQVMLLNKDLISAVSREFEDGYGYTRLLCNNVRNFIDNTNLCEAMKQTLAEEPQNFAAYNNGLSIVCSGIQQAEGSGEDCDPHIILQNAAIVNGGQTTANLYQDFKEASDEDKKALFSSGNTCTVIVAHSKEARKSISVCRNTQRTVSPSDSRSLDDDVVLLQKHLEYSGFRLKLKSGKDCSDSAKGTGKKKKTKSIKKIESIKQCSSIMRLAQVYVAFAVHQPIIGRNEGQTILADPVWFNSVVHGEYLQDNSFAAGLASMGVLNNVLYKIARAYKDCHTSAETEGIRYMGLYVLGIQADVLYRAYSTNNRKAAFKDLVYDIPAPLSLAGFKHKYSYVDDFSALLSHISLPRYDMNINHMSESEITALLVPAKLEKDGKSKDEDEFKGSFVDWLFKEAEIKSKYYEVPIKKGMKSDTNVLWSVAKDFCDGLMSYSYDTCEQKYPFLKLLKPYGE